MGPLGKLAIGGALVGTMLALTVAAAAHRTAPVPAALSLVEERDESAQTDVGQDSRRCRAITVPDPGCEAAWDERRRHFFGKGLRP